MQGVWRSEMSQVDKSEQPMMKQASGCWDFESQLSKARERDPPAERVRPMRCLAY